MTIKRISILILAATSLVAFEADLSAQNDAFFRLIPQQGSHQFPFFDHPTPVWNYNGQVPGPIIRGQSGTTLTIEAVNQLAEPTSVHWHGLRIDNAMDGVPGVTQDPIQPGDTFVYRLKLTEAGTFWYHPHLNAGEQLERGLKGILIVDPPDKDKLPWSQELVWILDDWRLQQDGTIYSHFNTHHDLMHDGRWGNVVTVNGQWKPDYLVSPGERIRLRLINGANARVFLPTFDNLDIKVIAVDGRPYPLFFLIEHFIYLPVTESIWISRFRLTQPEKHLKSTIASHARHFYWRGSKPEMKME